MDGFEQAFDDWMNEMIYQDYGDYYPSSEDEDLNLPDTHRWLLTWTEEIQCRGGVEAVIDYLANVPSPTYMQRHLEKQILAHGQQYPDMLAAAFVAGGYRDLSLKLGYNNRDKFDAGDSIEILHNYWQSIKDLPTTQTVDEDRETDVL